MEIKYLIIYLGNYNNFYLIFFIWLKQFFLKLTIFILIEKKKNSRKNYFFPEKNLNFKQKIYNFRNFLKKYVLLLKINDF
jgi:hypothetical protein